MLIGICSKAVLLRCIYCFKSFHESVCLIMVGCTWDMLKHKCVSVSFQSSLTARKRRFKLPYAVTTTVWYTP